MKNAFNLLFLLLLCRSLHAQQEATLSDHLHIQGGFGGPFFVFGQVEDHNGGGAGGGGAVIFNDFFIGAFGQAETFGQRTLYGRLYDLELAQGGPWLGYTWPSQRLVHGFASLKLGFGSVAFSRDEQYENDLDDGVVVVVPELGLEVNVAHWCRVAVSGGYRWMTGVTRLPGLSNTDFSNPVASLTLRFGRFHRRT